MDSINQSTRRIWELDFIRGIAIIAVVFIHTIFDINHLFIVSDKPILEGNAAFDALQHYGGVVFILISGICVTLGRRNIRRGLIVLGGGMIITVATYAGAALHLLGKGDRIDFGVLSCLGLCMLAYSLFENCNRYILGIIGVILVAAGLYAESISYPNNYLLILGMKSKSYAAGDYFPFIRNFGYYLIGAFLGKTLYRDGKTKFPFFSDKTPVINVFCATGRNTLVIYLAHQPLVFAVLWLIFPMR